jgi:16S rRNA processing protein RimM
MPMADQFSYPADRYLLVGKVVRAHGLRGELRVHCYSGDGQALCGYPELVLATPDGRLSPPLRLLAGRAQGGGAVVQLDSVASRSDAERLEKMAVLVARGHLPPAAAGEYYWDDLKGKEVETVAGRRIGRVSRIFSNGAQDVLVVTDADGEYFIPITREILVAEEPGKLVVDPPPGLLEINRPQTASPSGRSGDGL